MEYSFVDGFPVLILTVHLGINFSRHRKVNLSFSSFPFKKRLYRKPI